MDRKTNINRSIAIGAGWMVGMRMVDRLIGLVSIAILARLLLPYDFGLVAYAMTFFAVLGIFFNFSFETVLIRDQESGRPSYDTAWTLNIIIGVVLAVLLFASATPIAAFFHEPEVATILHWVAALPLIRGLANIGVVDFQKNMEFDREFLYNFLVRIVSAVITVGLAFYLRSYWALVIGNIIKEALRVILSYVLCAYRPHFALTMFERVFGFSFWLLLQNILSGINDRLPVFVIGRYFPAQAVAYFNIGMELSHMASQEMASPIRKALFPGVSIIAEDRARMVSMLVSAIGVIVLVGLPMTVGIAVTAPLIVPVMLGNNWLEAVPIIQVLSINSVTYILYSNCHIVFLALNKPHLTTLISLARTVFMVPLIVLVVPHYGALGAAWAFAGVNLFMMVVEYVMVLKMVELTMARVFEVTWRSMLAVTAMGAAVYFTYSQYLTGSQLPLTVQLILSIALGAIVYVLIVFPLWKMYGKPDHAETYMLTMIQKISGKLAPAKRKQAN